MRPSLKVCLIRPPTLMSGSSATDTLPPPLNLAYLAGALRKAGHEPFIVDAVGESPSNFVPLGNSRSLRGLSFDQIVARIPEDTALIGVTCMFSAEWVPIRALLAKIREAFPGRVIVGGGEHFTAAAELSLEQSPALSACALGEGEETLVELANALKEGRELGTVAGLVIRESGRTVRTGKRSRIKSVDDLARPAWDLVPLRNYFDNGMSYGVNRGRSIPMLASRGCPYQCTFCSSPLMWTTRWIARSPGEVADEIEEYVRRYDVRNVDFFDLTAIIRRDWVIQFCKELVRRGIRLTWQLPSGTRSEAIDAEVSRWLYRAGCRNLALAPESGSERILKKTKKRVKLANLLRTTRDAVREGLNVKLNIIVGFPDETHFDIWKTFWMMLRLSFHGAHDVMVGSFAPYPGTELYDRLVDEGRITHSDEYFNKLTYLDLGGAVSYSDHVSSAWLRVYIWFGFALFYGSNYLFRPHRVFLTARNILTKRHESRGEMALASLIERWRFALFGSRTALRPWR